MSKFNIHQWILSTKHWSLSIIPHISLYLLYIFYILIGACILYELESPKTKNSSLIKNFQDERERLLIKILEKRDIYDFDQYTKYVYKNLRQYEEELKRHLIFEDISSLNYSKALFIVSTSLTTIGGSSDFVPKTSLGKLFIIIYIGIGIPLTLVFLTDLCYLIKQLIEYIYSIFLLKFLNYIFSYFIQENNLIIIQIILTLIIYLSIGTCFISSKNFFDKFYLCFNVLFTINLNTTISKETNLFFMSIYTSFGLAIVLLYIKIIKRKMEKFLTNMGKRLLKNLINWAQQIGVHHIDTDDLLAHSDTNSSPLSDAVFFRPRPINRTKSLEQGSTLRPVGIAEPLRRLSTGFIRAFKPTDSDEEKTSDKSVQVSTIIRRCGRCAETCLPIRPLRKHSAISVASSSMTDVSSCGEDDDVMELPPPNLDRIRQRRATLVAKTIISQMATQPRSSSIEDLIPPRTLPLNQRRYSETSPLIVRQHIRKNSSDLPSPNDVNNQKEFREISKQISALLTPSDDESEAN